MKYSQEAISYQKSGRNEAWLYFILMAIGTFVFFIPAIQAKGTVDYAATLDFSFILSCPFMMITAFLLVYACCKTHICWAMKKGKYLCEDEFI